MSSAVNEAKRVLAENSRILFGFFGVVENSEVFPPRDFLNEFLLVGYDPCDQDQRMGTWSPFRLTNEEYVQIKEWWLQFHPGAREDSLGESSWHNWATALLERFD